jgi:hypothetical protein
VALPLFEESAALARETGDRDAVAVTLQNIARAHIALGDRERALALLLESLGIAAEIGSTRTLLYLLDVCIALAAQRIDWQRTARYFAAANAQLERLGLRRAPRPQDS